MRERLRQQLSDVEDDVWDAGEKDDLLGWALRRLNYKNPRPLDIEAANQIITLVADDYYYSLDASIISVERVDLYDADSNSLGPITAWEVAGDLLSGTGKIHISPSIVEGWVGGSVHLEATAATT